jgi:uncharacterized protein YsxB (DUF464 family)
MIKVIVKKAENFITEITLKGHALFADEGQDIVCASATTVAIVTANAIERLYGETAITSKAEHGEIKLLIKDTINNNIQLLLENMIESLKELEIQYSNHIKIL